MGGTAWLWASSESQESVDILMVDEAGQFAIANVLAVTQAAQSLVLLVDPQQLEQPTKGSHPDGVGLSALQLVLGASETMPLGAAFFSRKPGDFHLPSANSRPSCSTRTS